jgi:RHS repeat-associated protein
VRRARQLPAALAVVLVPLAATHSNARAPKLLASRGACPTYIEITQAPTRYYYQSTANISVAWGELDTGEWPPCLTGGDGPDPNTFRFTVDGVNRTSDFVVGSDGATATNFSLLNGVDIKLIATIVGYDEEFNTVTNADTVITSVNAGATQDSSFVDNQTVNPPDSVVERDLCLTIAAGSAAASECGDLRIVHPLPTVRTLGRERAPTLIYNSDHSNPFPLVAANVTLPSTAQVPDSVVAKLLVNGVQRATAKWAGSQWIWGQTRRIVIGFNGLGDATGVYPYTLELRNWYGSTAKSRTVTGTLAIVNRAASAFGAGWWLAGLEQLNTSTMTWVGGDGSVRVYRPAGTDVWVARNVDRPDTLKWVSPYYIRYLPHGVQVRFNSAGQHAVTRDRLSHETRFFHGTSGLLDSIVIPPGSSFTYRLTYSSGKLASVIAPGNRTTTVTMNGGRVSSIGDPDGTTVGFGFNGTQANRIASRTDRRGYATTYGYDATAWKLTSSFLNMAPTFQSIETLLEPLEIKGRAAAGSVDTANAYSLLNGPRTDVGDTTLFWLDRFGAPRRIRDPLGNVTELWRTDGIWPAAVTRIRYPDGRVVRSRYNTLGLVSSVTDSSFCQGGSCATTTYSYDLTWGFVSVIVRDTTLRDTTLFGYDVANGNRIWQRDARGDSTLVQFYYNDAYGYRLLTRVQPPNTVARDSFQYDSLGNLVRWTSPVFGRAQPAVSPATTIYENDPLGRAWRVTSAEGIQTSTYRDARNGRDTLVVTSGPQRSIGGDLVYDPIVWYAASASLKSVYDAEGNLTETRRWSSTGDIGTIVEKTPYDRANRPVAQVAADGAVDSTVYDPAGNAVRLITRRAHAIEQDFDAANRLVRRRVPSVVYDSTTFNGNWFDGGTYLADTVRLYYDALGRDTLAINRYARTRRVYHSNGLLLTEEQRIRSWAYRLASTWDAAGFDRHVFVVGYAYDLGGRRTILARPSNLRSWSLGASSDTTRYTYNAAGGLASLTDPYGGVFRFFYNAEGNLDSLAYPNGTGEKRWYDPNSGRLYYRTVRSQNTTACPTATGSESCFPNNVIRADTLSYDSDVRITVVRNAGREIFTTDYTGLGQVGRSITAYRSDTCAGGYCWTSREYFWPDALGNMVKRSIVTSTADAPRDSFAYQPEVGRLSSQADLVGDAWHWKPSSYDPAGNLRFTARWQLGWVCAVGDDVICTDYDQERYQPTTGYFYDAEQRLRGSRRYDGGKQYPNPEQAGGQEQYWYDAYGRRVLRLWLSDDIWNYATYYTENHLERYVWDGQQILYEVRTKLAGDTADMLVRGTEYGWVGYVQGPQLDSPLEAIEGDEQLAFPRLFLHPDWRGTITLGSLDDGSKDRWMGDVSPMVDWRRQNLSTYGERQTLFNQPPNRNYFGSLLARQSDGSKLQYLRNRYYDPNTGRFTQEDPIGLAGGLNLYGFANGDPVNFSDPFGLCEPWPECASGALASPGLFDPVMLLAGGIAGGIRSLFTRAFTRAAAADATAAGASSAAPRVANRALQRTLNELSRPGDRIAGGTAGAIRQEAMTLRPTGEVFHYQKGIERIANLQRILGREELSAADREVAEQALRELRDAVRMFEEAARRAAQQ